MSRQISLALVAALAASGCGGGASSSGGGGDTACAAPSGTYLPRPASSAAAPRLPPIPGAVAVTPSKDGDALTVAGALRGYRARLGQDDAPAAVTIVGYVARHNFAEAPACALHDQGTSDPKDCDAPVPVIWLADAPGEAARVVPVVFASSFAALYEALAEEKRPKPTPVVDKLLGTELPRPLPDIGAKVRVTGKHAALVGKLKKQPAASLRTGFITGERLEYLEKPKTAVKLGP